MDISKWNIFYTKYSAIKYLSRGKKKGLHCIQPANWKHPSEAIPQLFDLRMRFNCYEKACEPVWRCFLQWDWKITGNSEGKRASVLDLVWHMKPLGRNWRNETTDASVIKNASITNSHNFNQIFRFQLIRQWDKDSMRFVRMK